MEIGQDYKDNAADGIDRVALKLDHPYPNCNDDCNSIKIEEVGISKCHDDDSITTTFENMGDNKAPVKVGFEKIKNENFAEIDILHYLFDSGIQTENITSTNATCDLPLNRMKNEQGVGNGERSKLTSDTKEHLKEHNIKMEEDMLAVNIEVEEQESVMNSMKLEVLTEELDIKPGNAVSNSENLHAELDGMENEQSVENGEPSELTSDSKEHLKEHNIKMEEDMLAVDVEVGEQEYVMNSIKLEVLTEELDIKPGSDVSNSENLHVESDRMKNEQSVEDEELSKLISDTREHLKERNIKIEEDMLAVDVKVDEQESVMDSIKLEVWTEELDIKPTSDVSNGRNLHAELDSFPTDLKKRKLWVANMKIENWEPTKNDRLCSKHFEEKWLYRSDSHLRTRLLNEAIPTIFSDIPKCLQPRKATKRACTPEPQTQPGPSVSLSGSPHTPPPNLPQAEVESPRKKKLRRQLFQERVKNKIKTQKIRVLGKSLRRYKKKVISLKQIVSDLERSNLIKNEEALLLKSINKITKEMLERKNIKKGGYSLELLKFSITLNFFSPKAYNFVRTVFDTCLPHSSTIGKWLQTIDASPGFTSESFRTLEKHVQYSKKTVLCSLIIDEMSIRKHLESDGTKFNGYVNFGVNINDDNNELARQVFILLVVAINGSLKLPVGYFLTNGLSGEQKSSIVQQVINLVEKTAVKIVSLLAMEHPPI